MQSTMSIKVGDELRDILGKCKGASKTEVLKTFSDVSRRLRKLFPDFYLDESCYAATEWLRYAYRQRVLTWENLAILLRDNVDYMAIYRETGVNPLDVWRDPVSKNCGVSFWEEGGYYHGFEDENDYIDIIRKRVGEGRFIEVIKFITDAIIEKGENDGASISRTDALRGRSVTFWLHLNETNRYRVDGRPSKAEDVHTAGAKVFEAELLADRTFAKEIEETCSKVNDALSARLGIDGITAPGKRMHWDFAVSPDSGKHHFTHYFWVDEPKGNPLDWEHVTERACIDDPTGCLASFCSRWCLAGVSTMFGSTERNGLYITARRIQVDRSSQGVTTFIPRYYRFSDIEYRDEDFASFKRALDESFTKFRLQKGVTALKQDARDYRRKLQAEGLPPAEAWERTKKHMMWTHTTMSKRIGDKPVAERARYRRKDSRVSELLRREEEQRIKEEKRQAKAKKAGAMGISRSGAKNKA